MKIINAPDLHIADKRIKPEWHAKGIASLTTLAETVERERPDLVTIPGDLWHGGIQNSEAAGFPAVLRLIQRILDVCPIAAVAGTGSHDPVGAYKALTALKARHPFIFLDPAEMPLLAAWICESGQVEIGIDFGSKPRLMILGIPEPTKEWLLADCALPPEEAGAALKDGLRGILLGFGALRAQYPDVPCVFLGHFAVAGASMQNGQTVGPAEIVIGREDLQLIAPDITARYGGNGYPKEWGELGIAGFDMVDLHPGDTFGSLGHIHLAQEVVKGREILVTRFDYPHAPRKKITAVWKDADEPLGEPIEGFQVWQVYRATKEEAAEINEEEILAAMIAHGALPGSRVTVETIATETVRAPEIVEKRALREKVIVWAQASGLEVPESILLKADQLEREAAEHGQTQRTNIVIHSLKLRGAKGIYKGRKLLRRVLNLPALPLDDIEINFDDYDPGTIGLIGPTGAGKSTLFSFLAPYINMPGRRGALRRHFRLRDSLWELIFSDEYTGTLYRVLVEIDGVNKDGKCSYHLYANGAPINDGAKLSSDDFEAEVLKLFGSPELFVRRCYVTQTPTRANPDLSDTTEGDQKALVRELAGIDYLQADADSAKAKGDLLEADVERDQGQVSLIEGQLQALPALKADRSQKAGALAERQDALHGLELRGLSLKSDAEQLAEKVKQQELLQQKIAGLEDQAAQKRQAITAAEELIAGYKAAVEQAPAAQKILDDWTALKEREGKENERLAEVSKERERITAEHGRAQKAHADACRGLEADRSRLKTESARVAGDRNVLQAQIEHLQAELGTPLKENCPTCGQLLPETKRQELHEKRAVSETKLADLKQKHEEIRQRIFALNQEMAAIVLPPAPAEPTLPPVDQKPLQAIRASLAALNVEAARKSLATAQQAATRTEETRKQLSTLQNGLSILTINLESEQKKLDPKLALEHAKAQAKLEAARKDYQGAAKAVAALEQELKGLDARILELEPQAKDLQERKEKIAAAQTELAEWRLLQQGCGPDGIHALELDAFKPGIEATANALLSVVFGSRFTIDIRTTRSAGKGSKTHQAESFDIWIIDNEDNGSEQEFFLLSGGESVPVRLAIYEAFARIHEQKFSPMILDEADGKLDPSLRASYVEMIERARTEAHRRNTMVASHDTTVQEMIHQRIDLVELAKAEGKQEVAA